MESKSKNKSGRGKKNQEKSPEERGLRIPFYHDRFISLNQVVHYVMKHLFPTLFRLLLDKIYALLVLAVTIVADVVRHAVTISGRPHRLIEESEGSRVARPRLSPLTRL
jgi:hypothetical protein